MFEILAEEIIAKYDGNFARYTSYPTAPHFSEAFDGKKYALWLKNFPQDQAISLYIHIPFCAQLCWYCGCYTKITQRYAPIEDYVHLLAREIRLVGDVLGQKKRRLSHIHFGGGSPTMLLCKDFTFLMSVIGEVFEIAKDAEIAIEIDPRTVSAEKISTYVKNGVNRASIGVQDFNLEVQQAINRVQSFDVVWDCVKNLRAAGLEKINFDLIYGLPKQTVEDVKRNVDYAMLLKPSRIALFAYAHVLWKKKHMRMIDERDLPQSLERIKMYRAAAEKLARAGYVSLGLDHFALQDDEMVQMFLSKKLKRNFQGYSADKADYIVGIGASAIGYFAEGYAQNTLDFAEYKKCVLANEFAVAKGIEISKSDVIRKEIIDSLMCYLEVDLKKICQAFALLEDSFQTEFAALRELEKDGLVRLENWVIKINPSAPQISRVVASFFDEFFCASQKMHSRIS